MNDGTVGAGTPEAYNIEQRLQQQSQQQQQFYNGGSSSSSSNILDPNMRKVWIKLNYSFLL